LIFSINFPSINGVNFSKITGALAVAVPGELKGYWEVYKRFGSLSWERLITPTIKICEEGLLVTSGLANVIQEKAEDILESESLR
jgi:gamma-glutamyltranspeptidase / glutathione hydrolase / leukotriene-C4 hydrolase